MSTGGGFSMLPAVEGAAAGAAATGKGESVAVLSDLPWSSEPTKPKNDDCRTRCASRSVAVPSGEGECSGAGAGEDAGATASLLSSSGSSAGGGATVGRVPSEPDLLVLEPVLELARLRVEQLNVVFDLLQVLEFVAQVGLVGLLRQSELLPPPVQRRNRRVLVRRKGPAERGET
eukprot:scaffold18815_cov116-Isochrysis_galbana.AAC.3